MERYHTTQSIGAISDINTTPLVDVMLVLLIIFMISAPAVQHISTAKLPLAGPGGIDPPDIVTLDIRRIGTGASLAWQGEVTSLQNLPALVTANSALVNRKTGKPPEINLRTDPDTRYEAVAQVLATIKRSGGENIRFDELSR
jgi:biopolymer transport protein ExbD